MAAGTLTRESSHEQGRVGLTACTPDELARIARLNAAYRERFGFPFMLAVRGPRGDGLAKAQIFATFERRLEHHPDFEFAEALRNVHRVAELRLDDRFDAAAGARPTRRGTAPSCWRATPTRASPRTASSPSPTSPTRTALRRADRALDARVRLRRRRDRRRRQRRRRLPTRPARPARRALAHRLALRHRAQRRPVRRPARHLRADDRACASCSRAGRRLPFAIEVVAFAEEEGQRYKATFLGSGALVGQFDPTLARPASTPTA